jgi:hypothetical protein
MQFKKVPSWELPFVWHGKKRKSVDRITKWLLMPLLR